ncbi:MAG: dGTP triphosphohydrolase [Sedimenticola sp.]
MLTWEKLLCASRRKDIDGGKKSMNTAIHRTEIERDYDRILFSAPVRRMADKTQVFPMEKNDSVRTRLTHSHEVSNLARSFGVRLAFDHQNEVFGSDIIELAVQRNVPSMLAAVGLAHDLGNPPFGHRGEQAIREWFIENKGKLGLNEKEDIDFIEFDGNAQTFRLVTRLQVLNDKYGLNLTVGTLTALLKYPSVYGSKDKGGFKKYGVFQSEAEIVNQVWENTGLQPGQRHPLAYVMEACDDIAYSIIDAEDIVKKRYASFYDLMDHLESQCPGDEVVERVVDEVRKKNIKHKQDGLSSRELNDVSMQFFRVKAISELVEAATDCFVQNVNKMMDGSLAPGFDLLAHSPATALCESAQDFDMRHGFRHKDVLKLELQGNNYIRQTMDLLWPAIVKAEKTMTPFQKYAFGQISENYRRVYNDTDKGAYAKCQLLCDAVSGMTESYLIKVHDELKSLKTDVSKI